MKNKLRKLAQEMPFCTSCGDPNPNRDLLCLAHSNELRHGKGVGKKSDDLFGAYMCFDCHNVVDGRTGKLTKIEKREMHERAWIITMEWWINNGHIKEN
mgnify:CR=1 FL=1